MVDWPEFRDPSGGVWVWDNESKTYVYKDSAGLPQPDRGHATGGDNDLFSPNQIEHSELPGVPELEGIYGSALGDMIRNLPEGDPAKRTMDQIGRGKAKVVRCVNCNEDTDQAVCPQCGKDLTPEWNQQQDESQGWMDAQAPHSEASEFTSLPERVPKRNRMKTDDSYPSMTSSFHWAKKIISQDMTDDDWTDFFNTDEKYEVGKWIEDRNGSLHFEHGVGMPEDAETGKRGHQALADRHGLAWPDDLGAMGSIYNDGSADVQEILPEYQGQYNHETTSGKIKQAFGDHISVDPPLEQSGQDFVPTTSPVEITSGQWMIQKHVSGSAWVKERPIGEYNPQQILCAEHIQPDDYPLYRHGCRAIITATGGLTSHAAHLAVTQGIPVVVGIGRDYMKIQSGSHLTIDPTKKTITILPDVSGKMEPSQRRQIGEQIYDYYRQRDPYVQQQVASARPDYFSHIDEEIEWRLANTPTLDSCPECNSPMMDKSGEKVCHTCGHRQPIVQMRQTSLQIVSNKQPLVLKNSGETKDGLVVEALLGGERIGYLTALKRDDDFYVTDDVEVISQYRRQGIARAMVRKARETVPMIPYAEVPDQVYRSEAGKALAQHVASIRTAGPAIALLPELAGAAEGLAGAEEAAGAAGAAGEAGTAAGGGGGLLSGLGGNPMMMGMMMGQAMGGGDGQSQQQPDPQQENPGAYTASLGDDNEGLATDNRGDNSTKGDSSGDSWKEQGDSPELLKDVDGIGGPKSPHGQHGDPVLQDKATKAFELNKPLVIEFANSPESGADHPILKALDELLEAAFPGYKDGVEPGQDTTESPGTELEDVLEDGDEDAPDGIGDPDDHENFKKKNEEKADEKKKAAKNATLWDHLGFGVAPPAQIVPNAVNPAQQGAVSQLPCPRCGAMHDPSIPCPMPQASLMPGATGAPGTSTGTMPATHVITKVEDDFGDYTANLGDYEHWNEEAPRIWYEEEGKHPYEPDYQDDEEYVHGGDAARDAYAEELAEMSNEQLGGMLADPDYLARWPKAKPLIEWEIKNRGMQGLIGEQNIPGKDPTDPFSSIEDHFGSDEHIAATYALHGEPEHHRHHHEDWTDDQGQPLQEGGDYDLTMGDQAVPDRVTVDSINGAKISVTIHSGDIDYQTDISRQDVDTQGYKFTSPNDASDSMGDDLSQDVPPVRPGQDALPQVTDLSDTDTKVSSLEKYVGSFKGDDPAAREWLRDGGGEGVEVDPGLMAKLAGKDFSPREQREFIDEDGTARNLDKLDLENTHYIDDDLDHYTSLW